MPPKNKTPAPIDRPLSRAYLRQFTGWSTAYPPGVSEPTSLRLMENVMVHRDGSCGVRPGLRYYNYVTPPVEDVSVGTSAWPDNSVVGTHEMFFQQDGRKAYLYAVTETDDTVGFRVFADTETGPVIQTLAEADFALPDGGVTVLNFTAATTYVKYVQIDNKIFALSNAGETMRMFFVGQEKEAKLLTAITRPDWSIEDKLEVYHPEAAWVDSGVPISTRRNRFVNPTFQREEAPWAENSAYSRANRSGDFNHSGDYSMKVSSRHTRMNVVRSPLHDVGSTGVSTGWEPGPNTLTLQVSGTYMNIRFNAADDAGSALSTRMDVEPNTQYRMAFTLGTTTDVGNINPQVRFFDNAGNQIGDTFNIDRTMNNTAGRKVPRIFTTPKGCVSMRLVIRGERGPANGAANFLIKDVYCGLQSEGDTSPLAGAAGGAGDLFWTGTTNDSASVYHPPRDVAISTKVNVGAATWVASAYVRAGSTARNASINLRALKADNTQLLLDTGATTADVAGSWTRIENSIVAPANTDKVEAIIKIVNLVRGEVHYIDSAQFEGGATATTYFSGATPDAAGFDYEWTGEPHNSLSRVDEYANAGASDLNSETPTSNTLIATPASSNTYSFGFFYTISNDIGESAPSQSTIVRTKRGWSGWEWETPNVSGEPSGTRTNDPALCADQLAVTLPQDVFNAAIAAGATAWTLYMFTWSNQEAFPVSATRIGQRELNADSTWDLDGWNRATPSQADIASDVAAVPTKNTRINSSIPSSGGQGLVAADRMIMVFDPLAAGVIRYSSNQQGSYFDFSPSKGGGFKTLTSGNLFVPACVKLWQNPQSVDTLTILCMGIDGYSTSYYMTPAQIASQSEAVNIMGFEETTATPGTVSPYGCEVLNNSLYHPLDDQLMKSTASNYNINHKSQTEMILDQWQELRTKDKIVSSQMDMRLYYLVNNPSGAPLDEDCWGNEVWVFDAAAKTGTWSRWLVQGKSLRMMEKNGRIVMSVTHPTGIFYFDPDSSTDDYVDENGDIQSRSIPWKMETNTQGANRAHDAWANLQQANLISGNFTGQMRYGVRGLDINGKWQDVSKIVRDSNPASEEHFDLEDFLLIRRIMKEWFFYAESVTVDDVVQPSSGQISLVQYRYTPSTVNTGYEFGSVETFEYGRADQPTRTTDSGVPMPYIDTQRP